jgi:NTE family protein
MISLAEQLATKRIGLALASGFFGFYHHAGVLQALAARGISPARVTGVSAGALVGAMYAAGADPERLGDELLEVRRADFWDAGWPFGRNGFGLLAGHALASRLASVLPVHGFAQCRIPLTVSAYEISTGRVRYLSDGSLVQAVRASCAVPYLFAPVEVDGRAFWDGGFAEKTALVPFLEGPGVDVVVVSHMPPREERRSGSRRGLLSFLPSPAPLLADTPADERRERDARGRRLLEEAGIPVVTLAAPRIWLGPFSMDRARAAMDAGREGTLRLLDSVPDGA